MAERDAAAVDVDLLGIDLQLADAGYCLSGESFVQLDETDLIDRESGTFERLLGRRDRAQSHTARIHACHSSRYDSCHCRPSPPLAALRCRHKQCRRSIVDPAGAASRDGPVLLERRLQLRYGVQSRPGAWILILCKRRAI